MKPERQYQRVHQWLSYYHGKATKCENENCIKRNQKRFEWALKKDCKYEKKLENFIQLCPSCHRKYDFTPLIGKKISDSRNKKPVIQTTISGQFIREFESITLAASALNINKGNLQMCLNRNRKTSGGFKWQFKKV